jgi:dipeptidyl aminopeptidase/acylaminoacyl peptidase
VDDSGNANNGDIWIHDLDRPVGARVSRHPANESNPVWSPDGKQIVFWSSAQGSGDLFIHRVGDSVPPVYMTGEAELNEFPADWSKDGRTIALVRGPGWGREIWLYDLDSGETRPLQPGAARADGFLHAVDVALGGDVTLGRPTPLFRARVRLEEGYNYDVAPDGQSFVISSWIEEEAPRAMSLVLNWGP